MSQGLITKRRRVEASLDVLEGVREEFMGFLRNFGIDEEVVEGWKLVFTESFGNAVRHSRARVLGKEIGIEWERDGDIIWLRVEDPGPGPEGSQIEEPRLPEDPMQSHGRGLYIIEHFGDYVTHSVSEEGYRQGIGKRLN